MTTSFQVSSVRLTAAPPEGVQGGLIGWVSLILCGSLQLDGLALRRTLDGRLALAFPCRTDARGQRHHLVRPIDDRARREIEHAVFRALGLLEAAER